MAKKSAKSKGYRRQNVKKPYLSKKDIAVVCVIVALLAVGAFFLFRYDDGALKVEDGAVVAEGDNWLIGDGSKVRGSVRYFKLGEIGEIEGYSREKGAQTGDANIPRYAFTPAQEGGGDVSVTVTCEYGPSEYLAENTRGALKALETTTTSDIQTAELAGQSVRYYTYAADLTAKAAEGGEEAVASGETEASDEAGASDETEASDEAGASDETEASDATETAAEDAGADVGETSGDARFTRSIVGYVDATHDCSVVFHVLSKGDTDDDCLPDDALTALLEQAVAAVTLEPAK